MQKLHLVDRGYEEKSAAFTLAETLITLTILGVVAAITVPMLINKQMEAANRTKLKKAMAAYEKALNQMIIDNDIKGSITAVEGFGLTDNCSGSRPYFKAIKEIAGNNCRFQTADKVWWDITDIEHPVISLKDQLTDDIVAGVKSNSADYKDDKTLFSMTGEITNGLVRINDQADTGLSTEAKANLDKIYAFMNNNSFSQDDNNSHNCKTKECYLELYGNKSCSSLNDFSKPGTKVDTDDISCIYNNGEDYQIIDKNGFVVYDSSSNTIVETYDGYYKYLYNGLCTKEESGSYTYIDCPEEEISQSDKPTEPEDEPSKPKDKP